jgi:hypothetical protein
MLTCQLMMAAVSAIKRFDSLVHHMWSSARETLSSLRFWKTDGEAEF